MRPHQHGFYHGIPQSDLGNLCVVPNGIIPFDTTPFSTTTRVRFSASGSCVAEHVALRLRRIDRDVLQIRRVIHHLNGHDAINDTIDIGPFVTNLKSKSRQSSHLPTQWPHPPFETPAVSHATNHITNCDSESAIRRIALLRFVQLLGLLSFISKFPFKLFRLTTQNQLPLKCRVYRLTKP